MKRTELILTICFLAVAFIAFLYRGKYKNERANFNAIKVTEEFAKFDYEKVARGLMLDRLFVKALANFSIDPNVACLGQGMNIEMLKDIISDSSNTLILTFDRSCCFGCVEDEILKLSQFKDSLPYLSSIILGKFETPSNFLEIDVIRSNQIPAFCILDQDQVLPSELAVRPTYIVINGLCEVLDILVVDKEFPELSKIILGEIIKQFCWLP